MPEYIAVSDPALGRAQYRLNRVEMERRGRGQSCAGAFVVFVALLALQIPLRQAATGVWAPVGDVEPASSARLSLLVDLAMIAAYLNFTLRAVQLVHAWRRRSTVRRLLYPAAVAVVVGAGLDVAEDIALWRETVAVGWQGDLSVGWSWAKLLLVAGGLVGVVVATAWAWSRWGQRAAQGEAASDQVRPERVICCSGGGVRSASFCLGGLQELTTHGLYATSDFVIGVSGGGYIAAALHATRWHSHADDPDGHWAPLDPPAFALDSPEVQRLRRNSSYLLDSGNSTLQGALSVAFGIVVNLVLVAAVLGAMSWLLGWYLVASGALTGWDSADAGMLQFVGPWHRTMWVLWVPAAGVALFALEKVVVKFWTAPFALRTWSRYATEKLVVHGLVLMALLLGVPLLLAWVHDFAAHSGSSVAGLLHALGFVPSDVCVAQLNDPQDPVSACGVHLASPGAQPSPVQVGEVASVKRVAGGGATAVLLAVLAVAKSARTALGEEGAGGVKTGFAGLLAKVWSRTRAFVLPWVATSVVVVALVVLLLRWTAAFVAQPHLLSSWHLVFWVVAALLAVRVLTDVNRTSLHHFYRERLSHAFIVQRSQRSADALPYRKALRFSQSRPPAGRGPRLVICATANINDPGVVPVKRGCAPFVFDDQQFGLTDQNLPSGAALTPSALFEYAADRRFRDATIPAAMAISGAAFSPLAGRENKKLNPYRLVLALANARLGVWLPNPLWIDSVATVARLVRTQNTTETLRGWAVLTDEERQTLVGSHLGDRDRMWLWDLLSEQDSDQPLDPRYARPHDWRRPGAGVPPWKVMARRFVTALLSEQSKSGPGRLLKEAVGRTSVYDRRLYVTDGGHYDNLGLVEALRRRPAEIFVLDASADEEDTFGALGQAIATARMDLNCEVTFDPRSMRRLKAERSAAAWGNGSYEFPDGTSGVIRMVKVIMVEGLPWDVEAYAATNPQFPRTSTGNQLYDEFDLEAYRALGSEVTKKLIANPPVAQ